MSGPAWCRDHGEVPWSHRCAATEPTNAVRAGWAEDALSTFTVATYGGRTASGLHPGDRETAVADLICDLLHYARREGIDPDAAIASGARMFEEEETEEAEERREAAGLSVRVDRINPGDGFPRDLLWRTPYDAEGCAYRFRLMASGRWRVERFSFSEPIGVNVAEGTFGDVPSDEWIAATITAAIDGAS